MQLFPRLIELDPMGFQEDYKFLLVSPFQLTAEIGVLDL